MVLNNLRAPRVGRSTKAAQQSLSGYRYDNLSTCISSLYFAACGAFRSLVCS